MSDLVNELDDLDRLAKAFARAGEYEPAVGADLWKAADAILALSKLVRDSSARIEALEAALAEATRLMTEASREAGEWKGKYEAAGYPGTLDGWIEKAKALEAENARLLDALTGIYVYANDTLSGRVDGPDDRAWHRAGIVEIRNRAREFATTQSAIVARAAMARKAGT